MVVRGRAGGNHWAVVALANNGTEQLARWLVAPRSTRGQQRIVAVTPGSGEYPKYIARDIYALTLDPNSVTTYVIELQSAELPRLFLWDPEAFERNRRLGAAPHGP
jgi:hypothetical protein